MTIMHERCVLMTCAGCGGAYADPDTETVVHFVSAAAAIEQLAGESEWSLIEGGWDARCPDCALHVEERLPVRTGPCVVYCVTLACDECGQRIGDDPASELMPHWDDAAAACEAAHDWNWFANRGRVLCDRCIDRAGCALLEHTWGDWRDLVTWSYVGQSRTCRACGRSEFDPPPHPRQVA